MTHKRTTIRNALVSRLSGLATCGARVFPSRLRTLAAAEVPAILVSTEGETEDKPLLLGGLPMERALDVRVDIVVKASTGYETTADTILTEIEGALFDSVAHNTLGGVAHTTMLASIEAPEMDDSTDKPVVRLPVILRVIYTS